jgi:hypothetical protein
MQLVPHDPPRGEDACPHGSGDATPPSGWELVSARTTDEGDELILFRQVAPV